jgi:hypothetical protein
MLFGLCLFSTIQLCDAVYELLGGYLAGDLHKEEMYMALRLFHHYRGLILSLQMFPFSRPKLGSLSCLYWAVHCFRSPLLVEELLTELVRDNIEIIHVINEADIDVIVDLVKRKKNPDFLEFLAALCVCEGSAVHRYVGRGCVCCL